MRLLFTSNILEAVSLVAFYNYLPVLCFQPHIDPPPRCHFLLAEHQPASALCQPEKPYRIIFQNKCSNMDKAYFKSRSDMPYSFNGSVMIRARRVFKLVYIYVYQWFIFLELWYNKIKTLREKVFKANLIYVLYIKYMPPFPCYLHVHQCMFYFECFEVLCICIRKLNKNKVEFEVLQYYTSNYFIRTDKICSGLVEHTMSSVRMTDRISWFSETLK